MSIILGVILIVVAAIAGIALGYYLGKDALQKFNRQRQSELEQKIARIQTEAQQTADRKLEDAHRQAKKVLGEAERNAEEVKKEAERVRKNKEIESKELFLQRKAEFEEKTNKRQQAISALELKQKERENELKIKEKEIKLLETNVEKIRKDAEEQLLGMEEEKKRVAEQEREYSRALERIARLTQQEAKEELIKTIKDQADSEAMSYVKDKLEEAKMNASKEAKKIVIQTIQRMAAEYTIENTVSVFNLESDDLKGQIIGREGRNIRALEAATGVEIIVDDTPEAIIISSFDPVRREVCRLSLQRLVADGRIHPARIEEVVAKTRKQLEEQIMEIGQRTVIELGIHGMQPPLIRMVGRMRFRSSYGQNLLKHSIEVANLCATMAAELGLNPREVKMAKRAGLLHDIGKVSEEESELSHAILGMKLCEKHGEKPAIINAVGAHHDEMEMKFIISPIIQACDAISGARPGARREILESYIQRIQDLENLAMTYEGVQKVYAMQAGRELRVIVEADKVTDERAEELSFQISQRIQNEMQYPGQIKITVIREKRAVAFAR